MELLRNVFTWQEIASNIIWAFLLSGIFRAILKWLFRKTLEVREKAYWSLVPLAVLVCLASLNYVAKGTQLRQDLRGEVDSWITGTNPEVPNATAILLVVSIRNLGIPTTVEKWSLSVALGGGETRKANIIFVPENITLEKGPGEVWVWSGKDALYNKTVQEPIPTGGMVRGLLLFSLPNVRQENLMRPGNQLTLTYSDVQGKSYTVSHGISGIEGGMMYYPGLQTPRRIIEQK